MSQVPVNVSFSNFDEGWYSQLIYNRNYPTVPYSLIGAETRVSFKNKIMTDPSNVIASSGLLVNGSYKPITGTATSGTVLTYSGGNLSFLPASGSGGASVIKYVSYQGAPGGDGSLSNPYQTISEALFNLLPVSEMKTIYVLPGIYNESFSVRPNTVIIGAGPETQISPGNIISINTNGSLTGKYSFQNITLPDLFLEFIIEANTMELSMNGVTANSLNISSDMTSSVTMNLDDCTIPNISVSGNYLNCIDCSVSQNMTVNVQNACTLNRLNIGNLSVVTTFSPTITLLMTKSGACTFNGPFTVLRDAISNSVSVFSNGATETKSNDSSMFQMSTDNVLVGSSYPLTNLSRSSILGANASGFSSGTNRTAIGYGASVISDNQVAFSDTATTLKASGLNGHSAATSITYNAATGVINYMSSSGINKKNIQDLCPKKTAELIDMLCPRRYSWKHDNSESSGLIAEEVEQIVARLNSRDMNSLVARDKDGKAISVNYILLIPYLLKHVQTLRDEIVKLNSIVVNKKEWTSKDKTAEDQ